MGGFKVWRQRKPLSLNNTWFIFAGRHRVSKKLNKYILRVPHYASSDQLIKKCCVGNLNGVIRKRWPKFLHMWAGFLFNSLWSVSYKWMWVHTSVSAWDATASSRRAASVRSHPKARRRLPRERCGLRTLRHSFPRPVHTYTNLYITY